MSKKQTGKTGNKGRNRALITLGAIAAVVIIICSFVINSNFFYNKATALTVGDTKYTTAEFNYFYNTAYNQFYNSLGDYASAVIDSSRPLSEQYYTETESFADYFKQVAFTQMQEVTAAYDQAVARGLTLSAEDRQSIDDTVAQMELYGQLYGVTADQYLTQMYGKGFTTATLEKLLSRMALARQFYTETTEGYSFTEEELKAAYAAHKDEYDILSYRVYYVPNGDDAEAAYATADEIATAKDGEEFAALVLANAPEESRSAYTEPDSTLYVVDGASLAGYDYGSWLLESGRKANETTVVESSSGAGYYVVMFVGRDDNNYNTVSMRHILVQIQPDANGEITEEDRDEAKAKIEQIRTEFESGDRSEDSFAALANEYSDDAGSNTTGGLYEHVARNQMVQPIDEFLFSSDRVSGDTEILYYENTDHYTGYHLVYFVGQGEIYADYIADTSLRAENYEDWMENARAEYPVTEKFAMRFAG